jgi:hypothetical protein
LTRGFCSKEQELALRRLGREFLLKRAEICPDERGLLEEAEKGEGCLRKLS